MYQYKDLYVLDFSKTNYFFEFHHTIRDALDFPDYYGCNWDAFWDCLTDMTGRPVHMKIIGLDNVEKKFGHDFVETMLEILKDFKHYNDDAYSHEIQVEIVTDGKSVFLT